MIRLYHLAPHLKMPVKMLWLLLRFSWSVGAWDLYFKKNTISFLPSKQHPYISICIFNNNNNKKKTEMGDSLKKMDLKSSGDNRRMLEIRVWM